MNSSFFETGLSLEEAFFRKRDAELIEQHQKLDRMKRTLEALQEVSGIRNSGVLNKLIELNVSTALLSSIAVVPLVEVAWVDGKVDEEERQAVLAGADKNGVKEGSVDYELLDNWLKHRPPESLLEAWTHYIAGLCENMTDLERKTFREVVLDRARRVAQATGGILGLFKISPEESAVLRKMEKAFSARQ